MAPKDNIPKKDVLEKESSLSGLLHNNNHSKNLKSTETNLQSKIEEGNSKLVNSSNSTIDSVSSKTTKARKEEKHQTPQDKKKNKRRKQIHAQKERAKEEQINSTIEQIISNRSSSIIHENNNHNIKEKSIDNILKDSVSSLVQSGAVNSQIIGISSKTRSNNSNSQTKSHRKKRYIRNRQKLRRNTRIINSTENKAFQYREENFSQKTSRENYTSKVLATASESISAELRKKENATLAEELLSKSVTQLIDMPGDITRVINSGTNIHNKSRYMYKKLKKVKAYSPRKVNNLDQRELKNRIISAKEAYQKTFYSNEKEKHENMYASTEGVSQIVIQRTKKYAESLEEENAAIKATLKTTDAMYKVNRDRRYLKEANKKRQKQISPKKAFHSMRKKKFTKKNRFLKINEAVSKKAKKTIVIVAIIFVALMILPTAFISMITAILNYATYEEDNRSLAFIANNITKLDATYEYYVNTLEDNWSLLRFQPNVKFYNLTVPDCKGKGWDGITIDGFEIPLQYEPSSDIKAYTDYICLKYNEDGMDWDEETITKDITTIWKNLNHAQMVVKNKNNLDKPIYEDDKDKPIYEDDKSKPIYEDDKSKPIYGDDKSNPIYEVDRSRPVYQGDIAYDYFPCTPYYDWLSQKTIIGYKKRIKGYKQKIVGYKQKLVGYEQKLVGYEQKLVGYEQLHILTFTMHGVPMRTYLENDFEELLGTNKEIREKYELYKDMGGMLTRSVVANPLQDKILGVKNRFGYDLVLEEKDGKFSYKMEYRDYIELSTRSGWKLYAPITGTMTNTGKSIVIESPQNAKERYKVTLTNVNVASSKEVTQGECIGTVSDNLQIKFEIIEEKWFGILTDYEIADPCRFIDFSAFYDQKTNNADSEVNDFIKTAEQYLNYFYLFGGKTPNTSFDCSGFVSYAATKSNYRNIQASAEELRRACYSCFSSGEQKGDLIFFEDTYGEFGSDYATHVGIVVDPVNKIMLHCGSPIQYTRYDTAYYQKHFLCFGALK